MNHYENILVDWAVKQEDAALLTDNGDYIVYPFAKEIGIGKGIMLNTSDDISVFCGEHMYNANNICGDYDFGKIDGQFYNDVLIISTSWGGYSKNIEHDLDVISCFDDTNTMFKHANSFSFDLKHQTVSNLKVTTTSIPITSVIKLMGEANTRFLLDSLNIADAPSVAIASVPRAINNILNMAVAPHITGTMKHLFARSKVLEYLGELVSHFEHEQRKVVSTKLKSKQHRTMGRDARELIISKQGNVPSLVELACQMGISTRQLNTSFKAEFNMTPHQYIIRQRLTYAHRLLLESQISQKELAYQLGYSHVNHFITAFRKYFGYPPGHARFKAK